jgi:hypothetical protein
MCDDYDILKITQISNASQKSKLPGLIAYKLWEISLYYYSTLVVYSILLNIIFFFFFLYLFSYTIYLYNLNSIDFYEVQRKIIKVPMNIQRFRFMS